MNGAKAGSGARYAAVLIIGMLVGLILTTGVLQGKSPDIPLLCASLIGFLVGLGELISRYRDEPWSAILNRAAMFYAVLNALAAALALWAICMFKLEFGAPPEAVPLVRVCVGGFGAMAFFRSAFFTARVGDQDVAVGPSSFLGVILAAADRSVDRHRAEARAAYLSEQFISFEVSQEELPLVALALMQNLSPELQAQLADAVKKLQERTSIDDATRGLCLGLAVMNVVGEDLLGSSISLIRSAKQRAAEEIAKAKAKEQELEQARVAAAEAAQTALAEGDKANDEAANNLHALLADAQAKASFSQDGLVKLETRVKAIEEVASRLRAVSESGHTVADSTQITAASGGSDLAATARGAPPVEGEPPPKAGGGTES